ncbi:uncharacterized protein KY384_005542 [Bacidia gigantensis]|uniref:uncharacterized protein n=1 Tax=Bacidia gigantensis TaxID=2732470 RepID=UPI001D03FE60|nr:uncharacterized protein KY384_005542 [Bacidia gigantensis]KAG8530060.1 hypothetical protein KY384_005542 [Bacidia gigantensis]
MDAMEPQPALNIRHRLEALLTNSARLIINLTILLLTSPLPTNHIHSYVIYYFFSPLERENRMMEIFDGAYLTIRRLQCIAAIAFWSSIVCCYLYTVNRLPRVLEPWARCGKILLRLFALAMRLNILLAVVNFYGIEVSRYRRDYLKWELMTLAQLLANCVVTVVDQVG